MKQGKTGRNEPCPCGSGKKYKRCCYGKEVDGGDGLNNEFDVDTAVDEALSIDPNYLPAVNNRILVKNIKEGEKLGEEKFMAIDFNREKFLMGRR